MSLNVAARLRLGPFQLDACLRVEAGETVALIGPNGAGKSTLLRAVAGLAALDGGHIELDGLPLDDPGRGVFMPPEHRSVGVVFQDHLLFPHLSALENVAYGLRSRGVSRAQARHVAREWLERVGLADRAGARPGQLSGGQAQRVALARALASQPRLLLLDEPLSALDAQSRLEMRRELARHLASFPGPRLVVTHDPIEASNLADRLVIIEAGRIVQTGRPEEISAHPRSPYVAELVGVNLIAGRAERGVLHTVAGGTLVLPAPLEGAAVAVVHPRAVALYRHRPEGTPRNVWKGTVAGIDHGGERARVSVAGTVPIVAEVTSGAAADLGLAEGGEVWVSVKATEITAYPA